MILIKTNSPELTDQKQRKSRNYMKKGIAEGKVNREFILYGSFSRELSKVNKTTYEEMKEIVGAGLTHDNWFGEILKLQVPSRMEKDILSRNNQRQKRATLKTKRRPFQNVIS